MKFGRYTGRVRGVQNFEVVYIGVESSNEYFKHFSELKESTYEISTRLIPSDQEDLT